MVKVEVYLPDAQEPTDLVGYANHIAIQAGLDGARQPPGYFLFDNPESGDRTEVRTSD